MDLQLVFICFCVFLVGIHSRPKVFSGEGKQNQKMLKAILSLNLNKKVFCNQQYITSLIVTDLSNGYLKGVWKEENDVTFDLVGKPTAIELVSDVECNAKSYCTYRNYRMKSSLTANKWKPMTLSKKMEGPFFYTVNGSSVSVTVLGKTYTGTYDGKQQIVWPPRKYLPNGSTWTKQGKHCLI